MKNRWSYGYIIRDKEGNVRLEAEGYRTRKEVERAAKEALSIMPEDYNLEIRYASPVFKTPEIHGDLVWQKEEEEIPPNTIIH